MSVRCCEFLFNSFSISGSEGANEVLSRISALVDTGDYQNILLPADGFEVRLSNIVEVSDFADFFFVFGG